MKVGDTFPVSVAGVPVTEAKVTSMEDGIAELVFQGQRVKMSYVTSLAPEATAPVGETPNEPSTQTIVTGVDRRDKDGNIVHSTGEVNRSEGAAVGGEEVPPTVELVNPPVGPTTVPTSETATVEHVESVAQDAATDAQAAEEKATA